MTQFWLMRYDGRFVLEASGKSSSSSKRCMEEWEPTSALLPDVVCLGEMGELLLTTCGHGVDHTVQGGAG